MKIFGFEYKTRKELIEENKKLKTENRTMISKVENVSRYENYRVHKYRSEFIVTNGDELLSYQRIKEHLFEQLIQEVSRDIVFEKGIDSLGRIVYSAEIPVLRKE